MAAGSVFALWLVGALHFGYQLRTKKHSLIIRVFACLVNFGLSYTYFPQDFHTLKNFWLIQALKTAFYMLITFLLVFV